MTTLTPQPIDADSLLAWASMAEPGAALTYHVGNLVADKRGNGGLQAVARLALTLAGYRKPGEVGSKLSWVSRAPAVVLLFQVQQGPGRWAYKAVRTAVPMGRVGDGKADAAGERGPVLAHAQTLQHPGLSVASGQAWH